MKPNVQDTFFIKVRIIVCIKLIISIHVTYSYALVHIHATNQRSEIINDVCDNKQRQF